MMKYKLWCISINVRIPSIYPMTSNYLYIPVIYVACRTDIPFLYTFDLKRIIKKILISFYLVKIASINTKTIGEWVILLTFTRHQKGLRRIWIHFIFEYTSSLSYSLSLKVNLIWLFLYIKLSYGSEHGFRSYLLPKTSLFVTTPCLLAAAVARRTGKIIKMAFLFLKKEKIGYKGCPENKDSL